jgi:hypothetical protein
MKTTLPTFLFLFCASFVLGVDPGAIAEVKTLDGKVFQGVTISRVEPDGLRIFHSAGIAKIPVEMLPEDLKAKFNFDMSHAEAFRGEKKIEAEARAKAASEQRQTEAQNAADLAKAQIVIGKVVHITADGLVSIATKDSDQDRPGAENTWAFGIKPKEPALSRLESERSSLPASLNNYLAKNGPMWGSTSGINYVRENWIKNLSDYQKYFSLRNVFFASRFHKNLFSKPVINQEELLVLRPNSLLDGAVTGEIVLAYVTPDGNYLSETTERSYAAYRIIEICRER